MPVCAASVKRPSAANLNLGRHSTHSKAPHNRLFDGAGHRPLRYDPAGPVAALSWADGAVAYVVSGKADHDRLNEVAEKAFAQLESATVR